MITVTVWVYDQPNHAILTVLYTPPDKGGVPRYLIHNPGGGDPTAAAAEFLTATLGLVMVSSWTEVDDTWTGYAVRQDARKEVAVVAPNFTGPIGEGWGTITVTVAGEPLPPSNPPHSWLCAQQVVEDAAEEQLLAAGWRLATPWCPLAPEEYGYTPLLAAIVTPPLAAIVTKEG